MGGVHRVDGRVEALEGAPAKRRLGTVAGSAATAGAMLCLSAVPAWAAENMTLTFVRHGQSQANAAGVTDTSVPGPNLTQQGRDQAAAVAPILFPNGYNAIYASDMVRTQQTAQPLDGLMGNPPIVIKPGIQEIQAGLFEGTPETLGGAATALFAAPWAFGFKYSFIPGSESGYEFDYRTNNAIQDIYDARQTGVPLNAVAFSHFGTMAFWTLINAENADPLLLVTSPITNTSYIRYQGNPEDGWNVTQWNGTDINPDDPTFTSQVFVASRALGTTTNDNAAAIVGSIFSLDPAELFSALAAAATSEPTAIAQWVVSVGQALFGAASDIPGTATDAVGPGGLPGLGSLPDLGSLPSLAAADDGNDTAAARTAQVAGTSGNDTDTDDSPAVRTTSNGATDLKSGNKFAPGQVATAVTSRGQQAVQDVVDNVSGGIDASLKTVGDVVRTFTGTGPAAAADTGADADADGGSQDAA